MGGGEGGVRGKGVIVCLLNNLLVVAYTHTHKYTHTHTHTHTHTQGVVSGVIRGCGNQHIGFYVNLFAYYVIALPAVRHDSFICVTLLIYMCDMTRLYV